MSGYTQCLFAGSVQSKPEIERQSRSIVGDLFTSSRRSGVAGVHRPSFLTDEYSKSSNFGMCNAVDMASDSRSVLALNLPFRYYDQLNLELSRYLSTRCVSPNSAYKYKIAMAVKHSIYEAFVATLLVRSRLL